MILNFHNGLLMLWQIAHSYGGLVGTEAVTEDLAARYRQANGLSGGVGKNDLVLRAIIRQPCRGTV